ncbi:MAG: DNA-directed RNA polymerase subunit omega [Acidimicrobiales bacterium]
MATSHDSMITPPIEKLLATTDSKFRLVTLASQRARQINAYYGQLGEGLGAMIPPQVTSVAGKPISMALEEIAEGKIIAVDKVDEPEAEEGAEEAAEADGSDDDAG